MTQRHAQRAHALLGASKAEQWINCPPSARLQEKIPEKRSEYANEGEAAHELSEIKLRRRVLLCNAAERRKLDTQLKKLQAGPYYNAEMEDAVQAYVDFIEERFLAAKARSPDAVLILEERLDFSEWVPEGFGTGDVVIVADGLLEIVDLKYGKGVPVDAVGNAQMRLYALGAWSAYSYLYDIQNVTTTIVQPRFDSISTDTVPIEELLEWSETVVKPAAALAFAGEGEFQAGGHCRWCRVKGNCRARADANMAAIAYEFKDPALLEPEEIGSILYIAEQLKAWAKDVEDYAFEQAKRGGRIPQWKLVEGRSNRVIVDKDAARAAFQAAGVDPDKYLKPQEMLGIGELEKRIGKNDLAELLNGLILKPAGKPVLVPEMDKRPEMGSVENDFADIGMED